MILLPAGFEALKPFVERWAVEGSANRAALRGASSEDDRAAFFATGAPLAAAALDRLDARPLADHDAAEQRLMNLMLSLAHVSLAVDVQRDDEARHTPLRDAMVLTRAPADSPAA
ncbi:hypothetical protein [Sphingomonas sp. SUN039]|uniref:hypothetical protein n=1 Tax=Sphingomonas sp. SUN039 TaxID=2937787 RepID=UPI002164B58D|nr:hypothetical protein [Sphingomonas sp. SUN039]UVO52644.1 hypothetical protein M0209_00340 [Sphingomonas sp. SUN039]